MPKARSGDAGPGSRDSSILTMTAQCGFATVHPVEGRNSVTPKTAAQTPVVNDPYGGCKESCTHDLALGVLVSSLLEAEGPYPDSHPLLTTESLRNLSAQRLVSVIVD